MSSFKTFHFEPKSSFQIGCRKTIFIFFLSSRFISKFKSKGSYSVLLIVNFCIRQFNTFEFIVINGAFYRQFIGCVCGFDVNFCVCAFSGSGRRNIYGSCNNNARTLYKCYQHVHYRIGYWSWYSNWFIAVQYIGSGCCCIASSTKTSTGILDAMFISFSHPP